MDDTKLRELAAHIAGLRKLEAERKLLQAQMIRECVALLRMNPQTYRMRGHELGLDRSRIIKENQRQKALAPLHLETLATMLEDEAKLDTTC